MDALEKLGWLKDNSHIKYLYYVNDYNSEISIYRINIDMENGVSLKGAIEVQDIIALAEVLKKMMERKGH